IPTRPPAQLPTLSLHDALPIWPDRGHVGDGAHCFPREPDEPLAGCGGSTLPLAPRDRVLALEVERGREAGEFDAHDVPVRVPARSEEHTSELQSRSDLVCRLLL